MIDKELLEILACPACKGDVELKDNKIVCKKCGKVSCPGRDTSYVDRRSRRLNPNDQISISNKSPISNLRSSIDDCLIVN
jgi:hypothetical protein